MARARCYRCHRPQATCLCDLAVSLDNSVNVYVLQHPEETAHPRGTAIIAQLCLQHYQCWVAEDFTGHAGLAELIRQCPDTTLLVYPSEHAQILNGSSPPDAFDTLQGPVRNLVFIDASWRKAKKIWYSTAILHDLPCVSLQGQPPSRYRIRKVPGVNHLSTVESIACVLTWLEHRPTYYRPLLDIFDTMIDRQIASMGRATYRTNYLDIYANDTHEA